MKRREILKAAIAFPVVVALPVAVVRPVTTYTYHSTVTLPPIRWVPISEWSDRGMILPPPSKDFKMTRLTWASGFSYQANEGA